MHKPHSTHPSATTQQPWQRADVNGLQRCVAGVPRASRRACVPVPAASQEGVEVHDGRLPFLKGLMQFAQPREYADKVLQGHRLAWGKSGLPPRDSLFIADLEAVKQLAANEWQTGIGSDWPPSMRGLFGHSALSMTQDLALHARLRQVLGGTFTREAVAAMLPGLQATTTTHLARWAAATTSGATTTTTTTDGGSSSASNAGSSNGSGSGSNGADGTTRALAYPLARWLTFDILVNLVLGLPMSQAEVEQYSALFKTLVDGFAPPAWDLPFTAFGKGLAARRQLVARIQATLAGPNCSGALARLRDEFGPTSDVTADNALTLLFAGFDTTSSAITYMLWLLADHPEVVEKVRQEQAAVVAQHGLTLTAQACAAMPYTTAAVKESLRLAQVIAYLPRMATRELQVPNGPTLPAGCPFFYALAALSDADPALGGGGSDSSKSSSDDRAAFRPERWLDPAAAASLAKHQLPFGTGQRTCPGLHLANAEMTVVLAQLARGYTLSADTATEWRAFPIKRPDNNLPITLTPLPAAAVVGAGGVGGGAAEVVAAGAAAGVAVCV